MFGTGAFAVIALIVFVTGRENKKDPFFQDDMAQISAMSRQTRQDIRLIAFLLGAILVMLGIIADHLR